MPIRPENKARYPKGWKQIATAKKEAAGWRCEGSPSFPDCRAVHGEPHPVTEAVVVLSVAHLDHTPENVYDLNLKVWCQRCHNTYDAPMRRAGIERRKRLAAGIGDIFVPARKRR